MKVRPYYDRRFRDLGAPTSIRPDSRNLLAAVSFAATVALGVVVFSSHGNRAQSADSPARPPVLLESPTRVQEVAWAPVSRRVASRPAIDVDDVIDRLVDGDYETPEDLVTERCLDAFSEEDIVVFLEALDLEQLERLQGGRNWLIAFAPYEVHDVASVAYGQVRLRFLLRNERWMLDQIKVRPLGEEPR